MSEIRYKDIATHFRRLINDGELSPGDEMPPTRQVVKDFNTSSNTVGRAYRLLRDEGLVDTRPGAGTFVAERSDVTVTGVARLRRMKRTGKTHAPGETSTDHFVGLRSVGDVRIADMLGLEPHDEVIMRRRVQVVRGERKSVGLEIINVRVLEQAPEALEEGSAKGWWQNLYRERTNQEVVKSPERRGARLASDDELKALGISLPPTVAAPVLVVVNVFHDDQGPLSCWEDVYPPGKFQDEEE